MTRVLAHLDHRAVARGKDVGQRHQAQVERKVPRHDHTDHAQRLRDDAVAGPEKIAPVHRAALRLHPAGQVLDDMVNAIHHRKHLGQQGLVARAVAVVGADGITQGFLVLAHKTLKRAQIRLALGQRGHRVGQIGLSLQRKRSIKRAWGKGLVHCG